MPIIYYYNQAVVGETYTNISAHSVAVGNFVATSQISVDDFRNAGNTTITVQSATQQLSDYLSAAQGVTQFAGGPPAGGVAPFYLIVHPTTIINPPAPSTTSYSYDGCRFQCYATQGGSGHLMGYLHNSLTYDFQPKFDYIYSCPAALAGQNVGVERMKSVRWVALWDTENDTVMALRPLYTVSMSGTGWVGGDGNAYFYGQLVPISTAQAWFANIIQRTDPDDPNDQPGDSDSQDAEAPEGVNWSWLNQFKIMNWGDNDPWPAKMLVDIPANASTRYWYDNPHDYMAWNDDNDGDGYYHGGGVVYQSGYRNAKHAIIDKIAELHEWGTNLCGFDKITADSGKFIEYYNFYTDPVTGTYTRFGAEAASSTFTVNDDMSLTWSTATFYDLTISNNGSSFNLHTNYPNFPHWNRVNLETVGGIASDCVCIIRYRNHYYLGGVCGLTCSDNNDGVVGFCVLCRIDKLKDMPGYGGSDPDDPGNVGGDPDSPGIDPTDTFGPGGPGGSNPDTDKDVDTNTGDGTPTLDPGLGGPSGTGGLGQSGYYDDDGTYHAPDGTTYGPDDPNNPRNKGTGEKQSNPVNTARTPNIHDGSVGNGTGNPHQNDTQITNPSSTLPSGGTTGTIGGAGFLSIFTPTQQELTDFSGELFSTSALTAIKQYFSSNPMDGIFGLHMVPFTGFASNIIANPRIGTYDFNTTLTLAAEEFINVDYGEIDIPFVYDGYENYAPQSDAKIFLPFIGTKDIDINVIQGCKIHLYYNVSLVTGDIYAYLYCQWNSKYQQSGVDQGVDHLMYHWQGNCAVSIPISHVDSSNYISGAMQIAGGITSLAAGAVAGSPFTIPSGITGVTQGIAEMGRSSIITSGNISGVAAFMGAREPYLILSRPIIAFNNSYNHYLGRKSNAVCRIGILEEGSFTQMRNIDLSGVTATNDELQQIEGILKGGFYV